MKTYTLSILGSKWKLKVLPRETDPMFTTVDGYTDRSIRTMFVAGDSTHEMDDLNDYAEYTKVVKRHEIIHAFRTAYRPYRACFLERGCGHVF